MRTNEVTDRAKLAEFIRGLAIEASRGGFENSTLESFLESLAGWTADMDGYFANQGLDTPSQPDWELVANMLRAPTIYE